MECSICVSTFTKVLRREVQCPYCQFSFCLACLKTYLLVDVVTPRCLNVLCRKDWDMVFLAKNLSPSWMKKDWQAHMVKLLETKINQSMHLVEPMVAIIREIDGPEFKEYDLAYKKAILDARASNNQIKAKMSYQRALIRSFGGIIAGGNAVVSAFAEIQRVWATRVSVTNWCAVAKQQARAIIKGAGRRRRRGWTPRQATPGGMIDFRTGLAIDGAATPSPTEYRMPCPKTGCVGRVGAGKCNECGSKVCLDCHEERLAGHECDPAIVASVTAIGTDCKPCPTCATPTHKISGCNQMWCPIPCNTWWNYETGERDSETAFRHNPHFTEWLSLRSGGCREGDDEVTQWVQSGGIFRLALTPDQTQWVESIVGSPNNSSNKTFGEVAEALFPGSRLKLIEFNKYWENIQHCLAQQNVAASTLTDVDMKVLTAVRFRPGSRRKTIKKKIESNYQGIYRYELAQIQNAYAVISKGTIKQYMETPDATIEALTDALDAEAVKASEFAAEIRWKDDLSLGEEFYFKNMPVRAPVPRSRRFQFFRRKVKTRKRKRKTVAGTVAVA